MIENTAIATATEMQNNFGGILFNGFSCRNTERRYRFKSFMKLSTDGNNYGKEM